MLYLYVYENPAPLKFVSRKVRIMAHFLPNPDVSSRWGRAARSDVKSIHHVMVRVPLMACKTPILYRFGDVCHLNVIYCIKVSNAACSTQDAVVGARRQVKTLHGLLQKGSATGFREAIRFNLAATQMRVGLALSIILYASGVAHPFAYLA